MDISQWAERTVPVPQARKGRSVMRLFRYLASLGVLAACGGGSAAPAPMESVLRNPSGADVGRVTLRERGDRIVVFVRVAGLPQGEHGIHLHAVGRCDPPDFASAGGHLNPANLHHGHLNPQGPHLGDLGNLSVGGDGRGERSVEVVSAETRNGLRRFVGDSGLALVVHASRDDERTDPSGSSGARIACAVIR